MPSFSHRYFVLCGTVCVLFCFLCIAGCRKKKVASLNLPGKIAVLKPYTADDKRVRDKLTLQVRLFDSEGVQSFDVVANGRPVWRKTFARQGQDEVSVETTLSIEKMQLEDGQQTILLRIRDQKGQDSFQKLQLFVDRKGPTIKWLEPAPQSRITGVVRAELEVKDQSRVQSVEVYHVNRLVKRMVYAPYVFPLDPGDFSSGIVNFRVEAVDGLGNRSRQSFAFEVAGSQEGASCTKADSCKTPFICIRRVGAVKGICRQRCRYNQDCPKDMLCRRIKRRLKVCLPDTRPGKRRARVGVRVGLMQRCSTVNLCRKGLMCVTLDGVVSRCLRLCGSGLPRCPKWHRCTKVPGFNKRVCAPLRKKPTFRKVGERCSRDQPCVKTAACLIKKGQKYGVCYRKCQSNAECQAPMTCEQYPGKSFSVCFKLPHKVVGPYQTCSPQRKCRYGLECMTTRNSSQPRCFPSCKSGCGSSAVCARAGGYAVCLRRCDPRSPSCPPGTKCGLTLYNNKSAHLCR